MKIQHATGCIWRGIYLSHGHRQIFRAVLDPNACGASIGTRPTLSLAIFGRGVRLPMPYIPYRCTYYRPRRAWLAAYQLNARIWRKLANPQYFARRA
jgi:hypothetical protein